MELQDKKQRIIVEAMEDFPLYDGATVLKCTPALFMEKRNIHPIVKKTPQELYALGIKIGDRVTVEFNAQNWFVKPYYCLVVRLFNKHGKCVYDYYQEE